MFIAGSDTTAAVIRKTVFHIASCPRVYQRLKAEIATAVEAGAVSTPITWAEAKKLPYLQVRIYCLKRHIIDYQGSFLEPVEDVSFMNPP